MSYSYRILFFLLFSSSRELEEARNLLDGRVQEEGKAKEEMRERVRSLEGQLRDQLEEVSLVAFSFAALLHADPPVRPFVPPCTSIFLSLCPCP